MCTGHRGSIFGTFLDWIEKAEALFGLEIHGDFKLLFLGNSGGGAQAIHRAVSGMTAS
ncbi:MAG TPA: hypothetical protein PLB25_09085 [Rhodoferax sp.]|nr:hypothetical protein [Rhodoferax sp.]